MGFIFLKHTFWCTLKNTNVSAIKITDTTEMKLHGFTIDQRLKLDTSNDKQLKEARFKLHALCVIKLDAYK